MFLLLFIPQFSLNGQELEFVLEEPEERSEGIERIEKEETQISSEKANIGGLLLRSGYKTVQLRMTREEVSQKITQDPHLELDSQSTFGLLDQEQPYILKAQRLPWIRKIYYQFLRKGEIKEETTEETLDETETNPTKETNQPEETWVLYEILVHFDPKQFNYFSLYQSLSSRYGEATRRTPIYSTWQGESEQGISVEIRLLSPSSIQILDTELYGLRKRNLKQTQNQQLKKPLKDYEQQIKEILLGDFSPVSDNETTNSN